MNTFGRILRISDFGETHGLCIGGVVDGCPAGMTMDFDFIQQELDRRAPQSGVEAGTKRRERDQVKFLSGIHQGKTTGAPISFIIENQDVVINKNNDEILKPSHASFVLKEKYGHHCNEQGGYFSGRQTVSRVVAGAIAKLILKELGIQMSATLLSQAEIRECDTSGAVVECVVTGVPAGWGEPMYEGLDSRLAAAMLSIPSCKGFEVGEGFRSATMHGSEYNDMQKPGFHFFSNHDGGIQSGISNGQPILFRVAFKPIPSLPIAQKSVNYAGEEATYQGSDRNDRCVAPRVLPVVEAMAALVLADAMMLQNTNHFFVKKHEEI